MKYANNDQGRNEQPPQSFYHQETFQYVDENHPEMG